MEHRNHAVMETVRYGDITVGENAHGFKAMDGYGNMTSYHSSPDSALEAYEFGDFDYAIDGTGFLDEEKEVGSPAQAPFGFSSHYSYFPGLDSTFVDHHILRPQTSWRGVRGARPSFGALYPGREDWRLQPASPGDAGAILGRSGWSGYRGARPSFAGDDEFSIGPMHYKGDKALAFGLGVVSIMAIAGVFGRAR